MVTQAKIPFTRARRSVILYGIILAGAFTAFFLLMSAVGLMHVTELRFANYVFLFLIGFYQINLLVKQSPGYYLSYLQGLSVIFFTGLISFFLFTTFLYIYAQYDKDLKTLIYESVPLTSAYSLPIAYTTIFFEGSAISAIVAFIVMQYFKKEEERRDHN